MKSPEIKYYFSIRASVFVLVLLLVFIVAFSYSAFMAYNNNLTAAIFFVIIVLLIGILTLPTYIRFMKSIFKNQPALILSDDILVDNTNRLEYRWTDIKEIKEGPSNDESLEGYILIIFKHHNIPAKIAPSIIKGNKTDLLNDLINCHNKFG